MQDVNKTKQLPHIYIEKVVDWQVGASFEPCAQLLVWVEMNFLNPTIHSPASVWREFPTLGSIKGSSHPQLKHLELHSI